MTRRLPAEQRRAQLLEAALEMAEREGLAAITVRGVAERAGVSLGVVHYCFVDKDELLLEVINSVNCEVHQAAKAFLNVDFGSTEQGPERLRQRLYEAMELVWTVITASPERQLLTYEIVTYSLRQHGLPERGLARGQQEAHEAIIRLVLESTAQSCGMRWVGCMDDLVSVVLCMIEGLSLRWQIGRDDDEARRLMALGVQGVLAFAEPIAG